MKTKKNFLKKLTAGILGFVMTLGVGAAGYAASATETRAAEKTIEIDYATIMGDYSTAKSYSTTATPFTAGGVSFEASSFMNNGSKGSYIIQCQASNFKLYNTSALPGTLKSVRIEKTDSQAISLYTGTSSVSSFSGSGSSNSSTDKTWTTSNFGTDKTYFGFKKGTKASYITKITIVYTESSKTLSSIAVSNQKTSYTSGDSFVKPTVTATYDSGDPVDVSEDATFTVKKSGETSYGAIPTTFDLNYHGATIKASFTDGDVTKTDDYTISVTAPRELVSISVSGTPTKTTYYVGDDFDPAGLVVTGYYDSGDPEPITEGIEFVSEPETFTSTSQTSVEVLASYGDFTSEPYPVNGLTVQEKPKEFVATFAEGLSNNNGTEATDTTLKSNFGYSIDTNLTFEDISKLYGQQDQALKFGAGKNAGSFSISIPSTYQGKSIHIASVLLKAAYYGTDETTFNVEGNDIELTSSLAEYTVNFTAGNLTKIHFSTIAGKRVYFSEIKVKYDVNKSLSSISVSNNHRSFDLDTTFVPETVTATYSDGSSSEVTPTSITSPNMSTLGNQTISVSYTDSYGSASTSYIINVHYATVTSVTVSPNTYSLGVSGTLDLTTIDVTILPDNADQSTFGWTIDPDSKNPSTMDCSLSGTTFSAGNVPGTVDLICTAGDKSDELAVTISAGALISLDKTEVEGIANISSDAEVNATIYNYQSVTSITWTSNDEDVASVSGSSTKGTIKFLHEGSATVTCTAVVVNLLGVSETVSETVTVTVTKQLKSISAELTDPTKTYPENTNVPASDLSVTATYSDGQTGTATGFTVSEPLVTMSDTSIKISYTEGGITVTTDVTVTVVKATLKNLSFTNKTLDQFKQGDETHGKFSLGSNAAITAKYNTSFADENVVVNGVKQSPLKGELRFELCSRSGTSSYTYTKVTDIELNDPMLRSYNGLYLLAYYKYGESEVRADAALVTVAAPDIQVAVSEQSEAGYSLVTNITQLSAGDQIVIVSHDSSNGLQAYASGNNCKGTSVTKSSDNLTLSSKGEAATLTLSDADDGKFYLYDGAKYLYAASSSGNQLKGKDNKDSTNGAWKFTYANGYMTIVAEGSSNRNQMYYNPNSGSPIFACYSSKTSSYEYLDVYKYSSGGTKDVYYTISPELYDAIAALPSPLSSSNWSYLESLSSFVASGKEGTNDYKALKLGKAKTDGNMAEQFLAAYDSICGPQELRNYLGRTTLAPKRTIAYANTEGATLTGGTIAGSYDKYSTIELPTASKNGYNNATWWTLDGTSTGNWGSQVTTSFSLENNTTLYAKWIPIAYTITYELDGGTNHADNPSTYTIEDAITLKTPSKAGCEFSGWSNGGVINKGSTGNKTFTASWNALPQNITFTGSHVTSSGASTCLFGAQYNATFTADDSYVLPSSITVKLNGEDYLDYDYSSVDGSFSIASMPAGNISISVTAQQGAYQITYKEVDGTVITEPQLVKEYEFGVGAPLVDAHDRTGYKFVGWYSEPELVNKVESIAPTEKGNKIFYAKWAFAAQDALDSVQTSIGMSYTYQKDANAPIVSSSNPPTKVETRGTPTYHYEKITSTDDLENNTKYLIIYETGNVALNGNLATIDASSNTVAVTISSGQIASSTDIDNAAFTYNNGSFLGTNGKYIYHTGSKNTLDSSTSVQTNTVSFDEDGNVVLACDTYTLRYNNTSGQTRFRYYTSGQQSIQLYKQVSDKKAVTSIEIVGTPSKTTYNVGDAYSAAGLSVRATYEGGSQEIVTATITPSKQYAAEGDTSVTFSATYEEKTASLPVNVTVNSVYSNVSFKFNFKNTGMDALVSEYGDAFDDIGLVVEYGGRTRYFSFIHDDKGNYYIYEDGEDPTTFKMKDGGVFTMSLGDVINNLDRAATEFTVKAYIRDGENYYYSSNSTTYSVMTWISYYHSKSDYKDAVEDLYNIFFPNAQ